MRTQVFILALAILFPAACGFADNLQAEFISPPDSAKPWVYWYFMDGHITREGITADLESMKKAGIGGAIYLEVNVAIPRGPVVYFSKPWLDLFKHAVSEADRLGLEIAMPAGPGWCGSGGPWIKPEQSMQHLVASETPVTGPMHFDAVLAQSKPRAPFFGEGTLTPELRQQWERFYRDVAVLAFPTPEGNRRIDDVDEKALYFRPSVSSMAGTKMYLPAPAEYAKSPAGQCVDADKIVELTSHLTPDGKLSWDVPPGKWTILRLGRTTTGQITRPASIPGLGFESDKFDPAALDTQFASFEQVLLNAAGAARTPGRGLTMLHFDSWEMSSQNWSEKFREAFKTRRGYDPLPYLPAMIGHVVDSDETSERFLWDLRQTAQELVVANHAGRLKEFAHKNGLTLSLEPYDLDPCNDLTLGAAVDLPMGEFWSKGRGYSTEYSIIEAVSIGHTCGRPVIGAESFTADGTECWHQYPGSMKAQADWALCAGVNKFVIHRYQHQPYLNRYPGMTMGLYGVHWERTQTWWDMVSAFHLYLTRCSNMLRQGTPVADILYLTPEGAPQVFVPPASALHGELPDRKGYNFDGCSPEILIKNASVKDGRITFPGGAGYRLLVLPEVETMTPALLVKLQELLHAGATMMGAPPRKSPSLQDFPKCDDQVKQLAGEIWGQGAHGADRKVGAGRLIHDAGNSLYPEYSSTSQILERMGVQPDFQADGNIRYTHRRGDTFDIYFLSNTLETSDSCVCRFRVHGQQPQWWNPVNGETRDLPEYQEKDGITSIPLHFEPLESGFVIFRPAVPSKAAGGTNFAARKSLVEVTGPWNVSFDPKWGGPSKVTFDTLVDWTKRPEPGIKYYSGKATYQANFTMPGDILKANNRPLFVSLGSVKNMAAVRLNDTDLGIVWCPPWTVGIPAGVIHEGANTLQITVANLWINRLIGDSGLPIKQRLSWTTYSPYKPDSPLEPSGLLGPVEIQGDQSGK